MCWYSYQKLYAPSILIRSCALQFERIHPPNLFGFGLISVKTLADIVFMATPAPNDNEATLVIERTGQLSPEEARQLLDRFRTDARIQKLRVEFAADDLEDLPVQLRAQEETERANATPDGETVPLEPDEASGPPTEEPTEDDTAQPDESADVPRLQTGGVPFKLMRILDAYGSWFRTEEIRAAIPDDWDVNIDSIGTHLWNLEDRGLVEKRPYEEDNRKTEYRITSLGQRALDEALGRAEEQDQDDVDPLPDEKLTA